MSLNTQIAPSEKPYWIIVSDEGPSTHPRRHDTFESAQDESVRLAKLHPELEFGVFKYLGKTKATPTTAQKWYALFDSGGGGHVYLRNTGKERDKEVATLFDTKEEAEKSISYFTKPLGAFPIQVETGNQKVTYSTYRQSFFGGATMSSPFFYSLK